MQETKIITKDWGKLNPFLIDSYIKHGGYGQFKACLAGKFSPAAILGAIQDSGLKGRGGAGFPTGKKWQTAIAAAHQSSKAPVLIINADESQPGTFKDRLMLENNPHLVLEGALIAAYALSAGQILFYVNGGHQAQLAIIQKAIEQAEAKGFLMTEKNNVAQATNQIPNIVVKAIRGAGGYIYGEETALINSLEGQRGEPRIKPPYPVARGFFGRPTVVNNVETIANIVPILELGVDGFQKHGVPGSWGTKLFSVSGTVRNPGVYELPLGSSLEKLLKDCCGWMAKGKEFSFVRIGGTGKFLGTKALRYPLVYDQGVGKINVGLGDVLVVDKTVPVEDLMEAWSSFYARESCGQCTPCREGTKVLQKMATQLKNGILQAKKERQKLKDLLLAMEQTSLCPLGDFATKHWREFLNNPQIGASNKNNQSK